MKAQFVIAVIVSILILSVFVLSQSVYAHPGDGTVSSFQKISDTQGGFTGVLDDTDFFGGAMAGIGDLDGDGVEDIAVGAFFDDDGCPPDNPASTQFNENNCNRGAVWILFLNADGTVKSHQKISDTQGDFGGSLDSGEAFGLSVANIGDINNDGITDLAVGASPEDPGGAFLQRGAVYILFLDTDGTLNGAAPNGGFQRISAFDGDFAGTLDDFDRFGSSVAGIGDLNGDGVEDIAVGAELDDDGGVAASCPNGLLRNCDRGAVYILFMESDGTTKPGAAGFQKISDTAGDFAGTLDDNDLFGGNAVASLGDLNGDGITELAVGAIFDDDGGAERGAVWILFMGTDGKVDGFQKISDTEGDFAGTLDDLDFFGRSFANLGDLNGDSITDLAVGASGDDDGGGSKGAFWILFLDTDGKVKKTLSNSGFQKISDTAGNFGGTLVTADVFGSSVANIGDVDGDDITDLAVGARGDDDGGADRGAAWVLFMAPPSFEWDGGGDGVNWSDPLNWNTDTLPTSNDNIIIDNNGAITSSVILDIDFTINSGSTLTIDSDDELVINGGKTLTNDGIIANDGLLFINSGGNLINNAGTINNKKVSGFIHMEGTLTNNAGDTINNDGTIRILVRGSANIGVLNNFGTINNPGSIFISCGGTVNNSGTIATNQVVNLACVWDSGGVTDNWSEAANWNTNVVPDGDDDIIIDNDSGTNSDVHLDIDFTINSGSTLTITERDELIIDSGITLTNDGTITKSSFTLMTIFGTLTNSAGATINNQGVTNNECGGTVNNLGTITGKAINFRGCIWNGGGDGTNWSDRFNWLGDQVPSGDNDITIDILNRPSAFVHLDIDFTINSGHFLDINPGDSLTIDKGKTLTNNGRIEVDGVIENNSAVTINNNAGGIINNNAGGKIVNFAGATIKNLGTINNKCGGTVNNLGTITDNAIVQSTCTWDGGGDGTNWSDRFNWNTNAVPSGDNKIIIDNNSAANSVVHLDIDFTVNSGGSLTIDSGDKLLIDGGATLTNNGTVINDGTTKTLCGGTFNNLGTFTGNAIVQSTCIWDGGGATDNWSEAANWNPNAVPSGDNKIIIDNDSGTNSVVHLDIGLTINSGGSIRIDSRDKLIIDSGVTLTNEGTFTATGAFLIEGTFDNASTFIITCGLFTIKGTLDNTGTITNADCSSPSTNMLLRGGIINNNSGGIINIKNSLRDTGDPGTINNSGTINIEQLVGLSITGTLNNNSGGTINVSGTLASSLSGTINNQGLITIIDPPSIQRGIFSTGGITNNSGTIIIEASTDASSMSIIGTLNNTGKIINKSGSVIRLTTFKETSSTLNNNSGGTIDNNAGGIIENKASTLNNNAGATLNNLGTFNNICGGTFNNLGTFTGNAIVKPLCLWEAAFFSQNWSDRRHWESDVVPTGDADIIIGKNAVVHLDIDYTIDSGGSLTINSGSKLIIDPGKTLTNNGILNNNGIIENNSGLTINNNAGAIINNNAGAIINNNAGAIINNNAGAIINNPGAIINNGIIIDLGTINGADTISGAGDIFETTPQELLEEIIGQLSSIVKDNPGTPLADKVQDALTSAQTALVELNNTPADNQAAAGNIEGAVGDLQAAVDAGLLDSIEGGTSAARLLVILAINQGIGESCDPVVLSDAQQALAEGDLLALSAAFKDAVAKYKDALAKAESC